MRLIKKGYTIEDIYRLLDESELFRYYVTAFEEGKSFCSPFRKDRRPSSVIYRNENNHLIYKDFAEGIPNGDIFNILMYKYGITLQEAIRKIAADFNLSNEHILLPEQPQIERVPLKKEYSQIEVITKKFSKRDLNYWKQYLLEEEELKGAEIYSIDKYWITSKGKRTRGIRRTAELAFAYYFPEIDRWKLYFPERTEYKWISNVPLDYCEGLSEIKDCEQVIITKSRKDRLVLKKLVKNVVNCQNESISAISENTISVLNKCCKHKYIQFDADKTGKKNSIALTKKLGWNWLNVPNYLVKQGIKDYSDWLKEDGCYDYITKHLKKKKII